MIEKSDDFSREIYGGKSAEIIEYSWYTVVRQFGGKALEISTVI